MTLSITKHQDGYTLEGPAKWDGIRHHPNIEAVFRDALLRLEGRIDYLAGPSYGHAAVLDEPGQVVVAPTPPDLL